MINRLILLASMLSVAGILALMNFTNPNEIGPLGVLVFFTAVYVVMFGVSVLIVKVFSKIAGKKMDRKGYIYAAIVGFAPIMLLMVQSYGALRIWTIGLVALFVGIACFIVNRIL